MKLLQELFRIVAEDEEDEDDDDDDDDEFADFPGYKDSKDYITKFHALLKKCVKGGVLQLQHWTNSENYESIKKQGLVGSNHEHGFGTCCTIGHNAHQAWGHGNDVLLYINLPASYIENVEPDPNVTELGDSFADYENLLCWDFLENSPDPQDAEVIVNMKKIPTSMFTVAPVKSKNPPEKVAAKILSAKKFNAKKHK